MEELDIKWINLERVLNEFADRFIELAREHLQENSSNASYDLFNSFQKFIEIGDDYLSVKIGLEDYWKYVENGRGAGKFPPPDAIRNWIEIKPVSIVPDVNGKTPSVEQLTFLISRKIAMEGTEGKPFFEPAKAQALQEFSMAIDFAIQEDVAEYINRNVNEWMERTFGKK